MDVQKAQENMRVAYVGGAPGVAVSGIVWLAAGAVVRTHGIRAGVLTLFFGGIAIHPVAVLVARMLGRPGAHSKDNPLGRLALETTVMLLLGVGLASALSHSQLELFFPVMLVVIGARYLAFQTLYGIRLYWLCGIVLGALGIVSVLKDVPVGHLALWGGLLELLFSICIFRSTQRRGPS
jgi:hypothetical protein